MACHKSPLGLIDLFVRRLAKRGAAWYVTNDERYQPDYSRPVGDGPILGRVRSRVEDMRVAYHDFLDEAGVEKLFYTHFAFPTGRSFQPISQTSLRADSASPWRRTTSRRSA